MGSSQEVPNGAAVDKESVFFISTNCSVCGYALAVWRKWSIRIGTATGRARSSAGPDRLPLPWITHTHTHTRHQRKTDETAEESEAGKSASFRREREREFHFGWQTFGANLLMGRRRISDVPLPNAGFSR